MLSSAARRAKYSGIAQLVEQRTVNPWVVGSSPTAGAKFGSSFIRFRSLWRSDGHSIASSGRAYTLPGGTDIRRISMVVFLLLFPLIAVGQLHHKPLPYGLSEAAADAVKQWIFKPATLNGEAVDVLFNLTINFNLDKPKDSDSH